MSIIETIKNAVDTAVKKEDIVEYPTQDTFNEDPIEILVVEGEVENVSNENE